ncbi:MAG: acyltransferase domain-containing protein [Dorea sp.]
MNLQELTKRIHLPEQAQNVALNYILGEPEYQKWKELFYKDTKEFLEKWKESENHLQWVLSFYLQLTCEVYEEYKKKNITGDVFDATFYDITLWTQECYRKYGIYGLEEAYWIGMSVKMKLFRLGRLQFEPMILSEDMTGKTNVLKVGTKVLNVHIPAGERMDFEECKKSLKRAEDFFGDTYEAYVCDSWLLTPILKEFLPETSNIIRFQNMFEVTKVHYSFPQAEQRIFEDIREDKENYPEDTLLRRATKEYFVQGNDMGIGIGFFYK